MTISRTLSTLVLLVLTACAFTQVQEAVPLPTPTTVRVLQTTPVPTVNRQFQTVVSPSPELSPTPGAITCPAPEEQARTQYVIESQMDYPARTVAVHEVVHYLNRGEATLEQIVLLVKPNARPDIFTLESVTLGADGVGLSYELTGLRLTVDLPNALEANCAAELVLDFRLNVPAIDFGGVNAYQGYLGYSHRQTNLGHWLPVVAPRVARDWLTHEEVPIGEQDVLDESDWDVTLLVENAPENLRIAAPGTALKENAGHWRYTLAASRDYSLSLGEGFKVNTRKVNDNLVVELYSYDDAQIQTESGVIDSAAFALDVAAKSMEMYVDLYGGYPYERMAVVQGDFPDGMEFTGIVFVGGEYFRGFGGPTSYLMLITVHEISHQWWYGKVGNDQALNPWLDEALATYSEYVFIEEYFPALRDWWWGFRVNNFSPEGFVDSTVYEFDSRRAYINAVYLRGVRMMNDLREVLGTDVFFDWLARYAEAGAGRIMTPEDFWALLTPEQLEATTGVRERYLRQPQIIVIAPGT